MRDLTYSALKRNFQVMPGPEWLELLCRHIPDRCEDLECATTGGTRAVAEADAWTEAGERAVVMVRPVEDPCEAKTTAKAAWARLIRKVDEADSLVCPKCGGAMRVIAFRLIGPRGWGRT